jgi:MinD-like ATPase involved in chromosome partitioning or flagellar assembly
VTACLGLTLAEHCGDRIIALDANPDARTMGDRLRRARRPGDRVAGWVN